MNLYKIRPGGETEDFFLLSTTKNCGTFIKETHAESQETLEFKLTQKRKTFSFKPPISVEGFLIKRLRNLEVDNSNFYITEDNNKFKFYTEIVD